MLNAGQKYCRMLQGEHSATLSTFINLPFVFKTVVLSIFEWLLKTGFTVVSFLSARELSSFAIISEERAGCFDLTHLILASFLQDIDKQCKPRSDA